MAVDDLVRANEHGRELLSFVVFNLGVNTLFEALRVARISRCGVRWEGHTVIDTRNTRSEEAGLKEGRM
jgi:hypothetical protein